MAISDVFQINKIKADLEQTRKERDALKTILAESERMELYEVKQEIARLQDQKAQARLDLDREMEGCIKEKRACEDQVKAYQQEIQAKRQELVELDEEILLQSFGFYKPRYELQDSNAYKLSLEKIRDRQADMVKGGRAATCANSWTVNNSQAEGQRMIRDYTKLILRSFNNECDASIVAVKFNNIESIEKKIRKAFDTLNSLGARMQIAITQAYLQLKLEELYLCYEYQVKKQAEKEEQKRIREEMREQAKLMKEIEEAKARIEKEEKHFSKALETVTAQLAKAQTDAERAALEQEKAKIEQQLVEAEKTKADIQNREQSTRAGYVYIISNLGSFGEGVYKIGVTRRLDPQERIDELGDSSVPFDFDIHALIFSEDAPALETALHRAFDKRKLNMINQRREFFRVSLDEIERVVRTNFNKPVEITKLAEAAEYRQSVMLRGETIPSKDLVPA
jgi:hypothetical protein